ncbi:DUF4402 domain-containing protein [Novosphingobium sp. FSY-8]|uniref:DUF4402 domain-containing protein n=1 Tax=Novosphingobium ovatum TaxID=1908523 RepID=A0ABW9XED4_9SPHN|nr:DUF4402 domain-containing protein [Novosphingobium ovatum]NBC36886.1 DUF4402 domain-containing protein [Novosphingobium ovatum]
MTPALFRSALPRLPHLSGMAALLLSVAPSVAQAAQPSATKAGVAVSEVIAPITLYHARNHGAVVSAIASNGRSRASGNAELSFGKFTAGPAGGTVTVSASGSGSTGGDTRFVPGSSVSEDEFQVTGDPSRAFSIATTSGTVTRGSASMSFSTSPSALSGTLSNAGAGSFTVGGTLTVPAAIAPGVYTGSYSAMVAYN